MVIQSMDVTMQFKQPLNEIDPVLAFPPFIIKSGEFHCVLGESGCGKSTLLNILVGLLKPTKGRVLWDGKEVYGKMKVSEKNRYLSEKIGYMMQSSSLLGSLTIKENIVSTADLCRKYVSEEDVDTLLEELDIRRIKNSYPSRISGGEYRRAMLARTIIMKPSIIVADEPTGNLDKHSAAKVRELLIQYKNKGNAVIVATHDLCFTKEQVILHELNP